MSPNKRKLFDAGVFDQDDSFKHRRSSLRVNLSVSNLSDSGNGSLKQTHIECINTVLDTVKRGKVLLKGPSKHDSSKSRGKKSLNPETLDNSPKVYNGVYLKRVSIVLENISSNEQSLSTSCRELKDAILNKTKEIFDKKDEFSIKTAMVLEEHTETAAVKNKEHETPESESRINKQLSLENVVKLNPRISSTPKNKSRSRNISEPTNKSRLRKKRLFLQKTYSESTNTKDHESSLKNNFSNLSLTQREAHNSSVLTGSSKRLNMSKLSLRTPGKSLKGESKSHEKNYSVHCNNKPMSQTSNISEDESISGAVPIGWSTMIEENVSSEENEECPGSASKKPEDRVSKSPNRNTVTMELTSLQGGCLTYDQQCSPRIKARNDKLQKSSSKSRLNTESRRTENLEHILPSQKPSNAEDHGNSKIVRCKSVSGEMHNAEEAQCPLPLTDDSIRTVRSSLNVNTSTDVLNENRRKGTTNKRNISKDKRHSPYSKDREESYLRGRSTECGQETINTARSSLQVQTSLDGINKLRTGVNSPEKEDLIDLSLNRQSNEIQKSVVQKNNVDLEENLSLIERLRNISIPARASSNSNSGNNITSNREPDVVRTDSTIRNGNDSSKNKDDSKNSRSYVESTPYPTSRSVLLKSQLKQITVIKNFNADKKTCLSTTDKTYDHKNHLGDKEPDNANTYPHYLEPVVSNRPTSLYNNKDKVKYTKDTIILDDSPFPELHSVKPCGTVIIDESDDEVETENTNNADVPLSSPKTQPTKKTKKKLLPLRDSSQLMSLTPVEEQPISPKQTVFTKRRKKLEKKVNTKKANVQCDRNNVEWSKAKNTEQLSLEDDHVFRDTKKQKKQKKFRSKKIVINKIVNEDILNALEGARKNVGETQAEHSSSNGNSLNDFHAKRMSVQSQMNKLRRMIIVATGLSKEDKSLVASVVKALGMARMESNVTRRTTHVVSTGVRTINLLHGIIRGCWLLSLEWVLKSLENNKWLEPEEYEMTHFSKAVLENRKDRQLFGAAYIPELFATCGFVHVENGTKPPCNALKDLIKTAGGRITEDPRVAKIVIGTEGLKETWVLDCITTGELQSCNQYQRSKITQLK